LACPGPGSRKRYDRPDGRAWRSRPTAPGGHRGEFGLPDVSEV